MTARGSPREAVLQTARDGRRHMGYTGGGAPAGLGPPRNLFGIREAQP